MSRVLAAVHRSYTSSRMFNINTHANTNTTHGIGCKCELQTRDTNKCVPPMCIVVWQRRAHKNKTSRDTIHNHQGLYPGTSQELLAQILILSRSVSLCSLAREQFLPPETGKEQTPDYLLVCCCSVVVDVVACPAAAAAAAAAASRRRATHTVAFAEAAAASVI